jgi:hypothetical protein
MSLAANKILLANAATNTAGAYIQSYALGNATAVIPAGWYQVLATASGVIISDGVNFRANVLAGTPTITLYATNGGQNATGTYNS